MPTLNHAQGFFLLILLFIGYNYIKYINFLGILLKK